MIQRLFATPRLPLGVLLLAVLAACDTTPPPTPQPTTYTVTVDVVGAGTVTSVPEGIDVTSGGAPGTLVVDDGTEVTLTATAGSGSTFDGWSGACTGTGVCVVDVDEDVAVTATFVVSSGTLTVATDGDGAGNVTSDPAGIDLDENQTSATFSGGTEITLTAAAAAGSSFAGWDGVCDGEGDTCTFTFVEGTVITATFELPPPPLTLDVSVVSGPDAGGSVTSIPAGIDTATAETSADFPGDTKVTLTATATSGAFAGWVGGGCDDVRVPVCEVTMDAAKSVIGTFNEVQFQVVRVAAGGDDAVEFLGDSVAGQGFDPVRWLRGYVWVNVNFMDLGWAPYHNLTEAGIRFPAVSVPSGAIVSSAILEVTAAAANVDFPVEATKPVSLAIQGELSANPGVFVQPDVTETTFGITLRQRTAANITWDITTSWTTNTAYQAPDISSIVQEIVDQPTWSAGNAVALFMKGGTLDDIAYRRVRSFEAGAPVTRHPTLIIEYVVMPPLD